MTTQRRLAAVATGWLLAAGGTAAPAHAVIRECRAVPDRFTVFLSEPSSSAALGGAGNVRGFLEHLQFELDQNRDRQWIQSPATDVRFVACFKRVPALDGQEFVPLIVEDLYRNRVLLEVWGQLETDQTVPGTPELTAQINYLLVPVKFAANRNEPVAPALQRLSYAGKATAGTDFVQLIARPLDIDAFVAASFGLKLLRESDYDLAYRNVCRANVLLQRIAQRPLTGRSKDDIAALRTFLRESASAAITRARTDQTYPKTGGLWLQDPKDPCTGEE